MMLIEQTTVPTEALPVEEFSAHLQLGTGFADDGEQAPLLEALLRAAMAAVEGRIGKVLLTRDFVWTVTAWREVDRQALPVAPVVDVTRLTVIDRADNATDADVGTYRLEPDTHRPHVRATGSALPTIGIGGTAEIAFQAGFGATWDAIPADLAQAVFLLAAHYYEHRAAAGEGEKAMPFGVNMLLERWRTVRILGGGIC